MSAPKAQLEDYLEHTLETFEIRGLKDSYLSKDMVHDYFTKLSVEERAWFRVAIHAIEDNLKQARTAEIQAVLEAEGLA